MLYKISLVWHSPIYFFSSCPKWHIQKRVLLRAMVENLLPIFPSRSLMVSGLMLKSLIHFEFILVYGIRRYSSCNLLHVYVQFSWYCILTTLSLPHCIACSLYCRLTNHISMGFFLGSPLVPLTCFFYASSRLFWLLQPCNIAWYLVTWYLQLCSSFSKLPWLFGFFCGSI